MEKWNPEPTPERITSPNDEQITAETKEQMRQEVVNSLYEQGKLPDYGYDLEGRRVDFIGTDGRPVEVDLTTSQDQALNGMFAQSGLLPFVNGYSTASDAKATAGILTDLKDLSILLTGRASA